MEKEVKSENEEEKDVKFDLYYRTELLMIPGNQACC
jgi:hypothetical protein